MKPIKTTLVQRTAVALAAGLGCFALGAQAQSAVRLTGSGAVTSAECSYATMSVQPNGTVAVSCAGSIVTNGTSQPAGAVFTLSTSGGTITAGSAAAVSIVRSGGDGSITANFTVTGAACASSGSYSAAFAAAGSQQITQAATLTSAAAGSQCTVQLTGASSGTIGAPAIATYTIGGSSNPSPNPVPSGCPASPAGMLSFSFADRYLHNEGFLTVAGQPGPVFAVALPAVPASSFRGQLVWMPSPRVNTPAENGRVEWTISKCPGQVISDPSDMCNFAGEMNYNSRNWIPRPVGSIVDKASARGIGACWAPESEGPWYLNARYTSPTGCPYGATLCGINWQWN